LRWSYLRTNYTVEFQYIYKLRNLMTWIIIYLKKSNCTIKRIAIKTCCYHPMMVNYSLFIIRVIYLTLVCCLPPSDVAATVHGRSASIWQNVVSIPDQLVQESYQISACMSPLEPQNCHNIQKTQKPAHMHTHTQTHTCSRPYNIYIYQTDQSYHMNNEKVN